MEEALVSIKTSGATDVAVNSTAAESETDHGVDERASRTGEPNPEETRREESFSSIDLMNLLREYRDVEKQMRSRSRESMRVGETDVTALRILIRERAAGRVLRQRDLAEALGLTAASTSVLIDRLSREGYVQRIPHPEDRRSVALEILGDAEHQVNDTPEGIQERILAEAEGLSEEERAGAAKFLRGLISTVQETPEDAA